jgi:hypothetical protein
MSRTSPGRTLSHAEARSFYDRFAWLQEWQGYYESPALDLLRREGDFSAAHAVLELGGGTGRFAESACETVVSFAVPIQVVVARARDPMK